MAKLLIAEDDAALRSALHQALTLAGHDVRVAVNGEEAIQLQRRQPACLVVSDLVMPGMDGIELLIEMRRLSPGAKLIAISGGGWIEAGSFLRAAKCLGATRVLAKPFRIEELLQAVSDSLAAN
jgi:DNA-binding NtrC family response regulator